MRQTCVEAAKVVLIIININKLAKVPSKVEVPGESVGILMASFFWLWWVFEFWIWAIAFVSLGNWLCFLQASLSVSARWLLCLLLTTTMATLSLQQKKKKKKKLRQAAAAAAALVASLFASSVSGSAATTRNARRRRTLLPPPPPCMEFLLGRKLAGAIIADIGYVFFSRSHLLLLLLQLSRLSSLCR